MLLIDLFGMSALHAALITFRQDVFVTENARRVISTFTRCAVMNVREDMIESVSRVTLFFAEHKLLNNGIVYATTK